MSTPAGSPQPPDEWSPCKSGEISGLALSLKARRARTSRRRFTAVAAAGGLAAVGGWLALTRWPEPVHTLVQLSCREVRMQSERYLAGTLAADVVAGIDRHLSRCEHCRNFVNEHRSPTRPTSPSGA